MVRRSFVSPYPFLPMAPLWVSRSPPLLPTVTSTVSRFSRRVPHIEPYTRTLGTARSRADPPVPHFSLWRSQKKEAQVRCRRNGNRVFLSLSLLSPSSFPSLSHPYSFLSLFLFAELHRACLTPLRILVFFQPSWSSSSSSSSSSHRRGTLWVPLPTRSFSRFLRSPGSAFYQWSSTSPDDVEPTFPIPWSTFINRV